MAWLSLKKGKVMVTVRLPDTGKVIKNYLPVINLPAEFFFFLRINSHLGPDEKH